MRALPTLRTLELPSTSPRFREVVWELFRSRGESCLACSVLQALQGVLSLEFDIRGEDDSKQRSLPAGQTLQFHVTVHPSNIPAGREFPCAMEAWTDGGSFSARIRSEMETMEEFQFVKEWEGKCTNGFHVCRSGYGMRGVSSEDCGGGNALPRESHGNGDGGVTSEEPGGASRRLFFRGLADGRYGASSRGSGIVFRGAKSNRSHSRG